MNSITKKFHLDKLNTRECLLRKVNSVSNSGSPSFGTRNIAWEASTLPLSYTRPVNYALALTSCQGCLIDLYILNYH